MSYAVTIGYSDLKIIQEDKNMSLIINKDSAKNPPEPPKDANGNPIEPPKDANGNPIAPPKGFKPPMDGKCPHPPMGKDGRPPEPPKDANGNPIEPPKDANGNPIFPFKKP